MKWERRTHIKRPGMAELACGNCGVAFWIPPSKVGQRRCCSDHCTAESRGKAARERQRPCETCGGAFSPRPVQIANGGGRFCSQKCNAAGRDALRRPEVIERAATNLRLAYLTGSIRKPTGPDNKSWKGGLRASLARRTADGRIASQTRSWRLRNPERARELASRRGKAHVRTLPPGTLDRILKAQRGRCAICWVSLRAGYHADHITPWARKGPHVPANIQLLCAPCNLAKSARDPIDHMRSLGRLL